MQSARSKYGAVTDLAKTVALPGDHHPLRLPTYPNLERTAVVHFSRNTTITSSSTNIAAVTLLRNPVFPVWAAFNPSSAAASAYVSLTPPGTIEFSAAPNNQTVEFSGWTVGAPTGAGASSEYVKRFVVACDAAQRMGFWYPGGNAATLSVNVSATTGVAGEVDLAIYSAEWNLNSTATSSWEPYTKTMTLTAGIATSITEGSGFVVPLRFRIASSSAAGSIDLINFGYFSSGGSLGAPTGTMSTGYYPLFDPTEFTNSAVPYVASRVTASSLLCSNVTSVLNKEGTILGARLSTRIGSPYSRDPTTVSSVNPNERYFGPLETGAYAFTLSDAESEVFQDCVYNAGTSISPVWKPLFRFQEIGYYTQLFFNDLDSAAATTMAVSLHQHLEFRTASSLFPLDYSPYPLEEYHRAQLVLARLGTISENPIHIAAIASAVAKAASQLLPYAMPVLNDVAARYLVPGANRLLKASVEKWGTTREKPTTPKPQQSQDSKRASKGNAKPRAKPKAAPAKGQKA